MTRITTIATQKGESHMNERDQLMILIQEIADSRVIHLIYTFAARLVRHSRNGVSK